MKQLDVPVALVIFRRPDKTKRVLEEIAKVRPRQLFVIADGPHPHNEAERALCEASRDVIKTVHWPCEIFTNFADSNMGGPRRQPSGINWIFEYVDRAIILEDDCVPHSTFFEYCKILLDRYENDQRVMHIAGTNYQSEYLPEKASYYFSRYTHGTGWATWRRAWQHFDANVERHWPVLNASGWFEDLSINIEEKAYWSNLMKRLYEGEIDHWDYRWLFSCWLNGGLSTIPQRNLVSNIGFGPGASNTTNSDSIYAGLPTFAIDIPLQHPSLVTRDRRGDMLVQKKFFSKKKASDRIRNGLIRRAKKIIG